jgi:tellurite resistance protein
MSGFTGEDSFGKRRRALEESFFEQRNQELLEQLRQRQSEQAHKDQLAAASGITDDAVLQQLVSLNIGAETVAALALVPLVQVAWSDGSIDPKERSAILAAAAESGLEQQSPSYQLLDSWLEQRPDPSLMVAWKDYMRAVCHMLGGEAAASLGDGLLERARNVARAAGGILGLGGKISSSERAVLDELQQVFTGE